MSVLDFVYGGAPVGLVRPSNERSTVLGGCNPFDYMRTRANGSTPVGLICGARDSSTSRNTSTSGTLLDLTFTALSHFPCRLICRLPPPSPALVMSLTGMEARFHAPSSAELPTPPHAAT